MIQGIVLLCLLVGLHLSAGVQLNLTLSAAAVVEDQTVVFTCSVGDVTDKENKIYLISVRNSKSVVRCYFTDNGSKCIGTSAFVGYSCNCGVGTSDSDVKQYTLTRVVSGEDVATWHCENEKYNRSTAVIISFNYGPHYITLSGNQAGIDADGVNELSLICSTAEMFGSPLITWMNVTSGSMITNNASIDTFGPTDLHKMQQLKLIPHWFQDRNVIQCVVTNIETNKTVRSNNVTLDLRYAPEVTITWQLDSSGTSVEVICSADGNPSNFKFKIRHFWGETYIREIRGELVESDKYTVKTSYTYMDAGTYQCGVSNRIQGSNNANTHIEVDVIPVLLNETQRDESVFVVIGKPVSLNKIIFSRAKITVYTWMNEFGQNTTEISDLNITLNIYNKKVEDVGYKMTLMIPNVNETDLGVYTLKVCNRFGCDQFKTTITDDTNTHPSSSNQVSGSIVGVVLIIILLW